MTSFALLHYFQPWFLPPGVNLLLALVGLSLYFFKPRMGKACILMSLISLWLFSAPIFAYNLLDRLQYQYPSLSEAALRQPETRAAIVVLGGGDAIAVEQDSKSAVTDTTLSRVRYAAYLHKKTKLPLILSGGHEAGTSATQAASMLQALRQDFNVMDAFQEDKSINTAEQSKFLVPILKQHGFTIIYLITNAWHMPRSVYNFNKEGIAVIPAPMGYQVYDHHYTLLSYFPDMHALAATSIALHEFIGLLWYRLHDQA